MGYYRAYGSYKRTKTERIKDTAYVFFAGVAVVFAICFVLFVIIAGIQELVWISGVNNCKNYATGTGLYTHYSKHFLSQDYCWVRLPGGRTIDASSIKAVLNLTK